MKLGRRGFIGALLAALGLRRAPKNPLAGCFPDGWKPDSATIPRLARLQQEYRNAQGLPPNHAVGIPLEWL